MMRELNQLELDSVSGGNLLEEILQMPFIDAIAGACYGALAGAFVGGVGGGLAGSYLGGGIFGVVGGSLGYLSTTVVGAIGGLIMGFFRGYEQMQTLMPLDTAWESVINMINKDSGSANPVVVIS